MKREIKQVFIGVDENLNRLAAEAELRGDVKTCYPPRVSNDKEEPRGFFETLERSIHEFSGFHDETCMTLARGEDKELMKLLLQSDDYEDQKEVGRLVARGLFDKWGKE